MEILIGSRRASATARRDNVIPHPRSRHSLGGHFFDGMTASRQRLRIQELRRSGLSVDLVAVITRRGIGAVNDALEVRA